MMGEYADAYYRNEIKNKYGYDPGSMYDERSEKPKKLLPSKVACGICGKHFKGEQGVKDHKRDAHKVKE